MSRKRQGLMRLLRGTEWIAIIFLVVALYLAWPLLTFKTFPHVPLRAHVGMVLMIIANVILRRAGRSDHPK